MGWLSIFPICPLCQKSETRLKIPSGFPLVSTLMDLGLQPLPKEGQASDQGSVSME